MLKMTAEYTVRLVDYTEDDGVPSLLERETTEMERLMEDNMTSLLMEEALSNKGKAEVKCTSFEVVDANDEP